MKSEHIFGKKELKSRETNGMSVVESHSVISQVLQLKSGYYWMWFTGHGSHYNFYNRRNKGNALDQGAKMGYNALNQKNKMSNALN